MSFFGLENNDLEEEKRKFLSGGLRANEDIAVYNWGHDDYDGLGNALQEGGDELNDETFGSAGPVGKDFDFAAQQLPESDRQSRPQAESFHQQDPHQAPVDQPRTGARESLWENKSPFSVLPRAGGTGSLGRNSGVAHQSSPSGTSVGRFAPTMGREGSPAVPIQQPQQQQQQQQQFQQSPIPNAGGTVNYASTGVRTLQEIEAEMRAQTQQARALHAQQAFQQQQQQARAQLIQQQQLQQQLPPQAKPPRMRSQSPSTLVQYQTGGMRIQSPGIAFTHDQREALGSLPVEDVERQMRQQMINAARRQEIYGYRQESIPPPPHERSPFQPGHSQTPSMSELQAYLQQLMIEEATRDRRGRQSAPRQPTLEDVQSLLRQQQAMQIANLQQQRVSPAPRYIQQQQQLQQQQSLNGPQSLQDIQNMQMHQRLLAQLAQVEFAQANSGLASGNGKNHEALTAEAVRKIMEAEKQEGRRRRKAAKIAHMSRYNDLMTQSDKDFITRIQVSQLVTADPYTEDFYAQVYGSLLRSRLGISSQEERVLKFGSGEGVGLGLSQRGTGRRPNAMQRMEAQVERIVNNARQREKEKGLHAIHSLQGALGKTAGRSYKAAPRQLLQVDANGATESPHAHGHISKDDAKEHAAGAAKEAAKRGREALGDSTGVVRRDPLTRREVLVQIEKLYDIVLDLEQMRREQPDDERNIPAWESMYAVKVQQLWDGLQIMVPLETSDPHPFISLLKPAKGKRLIPRVARHLSSQQMLTVLTLLVACFSQLDVVVGAPLLDSLEDSQERREVDEQTQLFLSTVMQTMIPVISKTALRLISGLMGLLMERSELHIVARSRAGLSLLTAFLSRVEVIKTDLMSNTLDPTEMPTEEDSLSWVNVYQHLFHTLVPHLLSLFPSTRIPALKTQANPGLNPDILDQPVWQFLATLSLQANHEQQSVIVSTLREKILENVLAVNKGWVTDEEEQRIKITNVNILLHALGLDSSQINL